MGRASNRRKEVKKQRKYTKIIKTYRENPVKWIENMFGDKLYWYQRLMLSLLCKNRNKVQYIDFTNGSRITTIPTKDNKRSKGRWVYYE